MIGKHDRAGNCTNASQNMEVIFQGICLTNPRFATRPINSSKTLDDQESFQIEVCGDY